MTSSQLGGCKLTLFHSLEIISIKKKYAKRWKGGSIQFVILNAFADNIICIL